MQVKLDEKTINSELKKKKISKRKRSECIWGYIMIFPTLFGLVILNIKPLIDTFLLSFKQVGIFGTGSFVGFSNYIKLFHDTEVIQATFNTFKYTIMVVPITIIFSLVIAVMLNSKIKGKTIYRTIYFIPMIATPAAIAMVWRWLYNSQYGIINYLLSLMGINGPNWLSSPNLALASIAIVGIWSGIGYNMVLLLAGLQEIPKDYYEAASIDGAGPITKFFRITLPLVSPTMFFVIVTSIIGSLQVFDTIFMMIDKASNVLDNTQSLVYLFYKYSFIMNDKGYASTIVVFLFIIIMIITFFQVKGQKKWVNYD